MNKQTLGQTIATLRKEKNLTQAQLAEKMGVTDKAVSKWERDLSSPDISSIPKLSEILGISVEELLQSKASKEEKPGKSKAAAFITVALKALALGIGIPVCVLSVMGKLDLETGFPLLSVVVVCLAILQIFKNE